MSHTIKTAFDALSIQITDPSITAVDTMVASFQVRQKHAIALNSQSIGLVPIVFTDADREALFTIFDVDQKYLKTIVQKIPYINNDFIIISDPFNLLCVWLLHLATTQIKDQTKRKQFMLNIAKYLYYRFFTSLVNHYFPHGAVEKYMTAAINGLSRKFDIVVYGTWKAMIEAQCLELISSDGLHHSSIMNADDDKLFVYIISDIQSRIRDKVKLITKAYYDARDDNDTIGSRSAVAESEHGQFLVHNTKTLDVMIYNLSNEIMAERLFVDAETIRLLANQFSAITEDLLRTALLAMVEIAVTQADSKQLDAVKINEGRDLYVGMRVFIANTIQKTYSHCRRNGVDITNKAEVFIKAKNVYSSSRISDEDILSIKQSVSYLVDVISTSKRETTRSSLRIAILLYILIRSFRFI